MDCPDAGVRLALAAEALVGAPFRLHGRDVATGLDCVGVIAAALAGAGWSGAAWPTDYTMRMRGIGRFLARAETLGFAEVRGERRAGDVVLVVPGAAHVHFALVDREGGVVHADAGLRRVVRSAWPAAWRAERQWRWRGF